jgi:hypothetical protein
MFFRKGWQKMKTINILRILALALAFSLSLVLIPATPALALPEITISPSFGSVGTQVTVSGTGFESFAGTDINIFFDGEEIAASPLTVPENGTFTTSFEVPDETESGTAYVKVTTVIGGEVRKSFIVEEPGIELDIDVGAVGTTVTVEGRGFYAGGAIDLYYYRDGGRVSVGEEVAGDTGAFAYAFAIPDSTAGRHKIGAEDLLDNSDEANFEVIPAVTVSPSSGAIGDDLTLSGAGFGGNSDVTVYFSNVMVAVSSSNKYGSFEASFSVPVLESGTYNIEAEDEADNKASLAFTVASGATLSQAAGSVGTALIVNGVGFKANTIVAISYDDQQVATAATGDGGSFSVTFVVPPSPGGPHNVSINDGTNTATCVFTMETDSPAAPVLISPEDNTRVGAMASFDWEDVEDESGVTYTLQVATKDSFATSYIVLERVGLSDSECTLTEEEKLEPSSKESPHYWRVKAVDEAANEGEWSDVGSFYVGSRFTLSETVKKVLIGLGIAGAGFLGFWLGRRTAYARRV